MIEDLFLNELKGDFNYIRKWSNSMERKIEPLFEDLNRMAKILNAIQNHSDCTEELFTMIEEMKDYVE